MTLVIVGTVRVPLDRIADARPAMDAMVAASRAEDGCLDYAYAHDIADAGLIRVMEVWRDRAARREPAYRGMARAMAGAGDRPARPADVRGG